MLRKVKSVFTSRPATDGEDVDLQRLDFFSGQLDPFLMIDEIKAQAGLKLKGFPPHPHRGIQTLSYLRHGSMQHQDSLGNKGEVHPGGLQWMDSGEGILHSEIPVTDAQGLWGYQLWLNLPSERKYQPPRYQDISAAETAEFIGDNIKFKALAGEWQFNDKTLTSQFDRLSGKAALAEVNLMHNSEIDIQASETTFALYVIHGRIQVNDEQHIKSDQLVTFQQGSRIQITGSEHENIVLLLKGEPIGEPIVHYGPFVMNTQTEIKQTIRAYNEGEFGHL